MCAINPKFPKVVFGKSFAVRSRGIPSMNVFNNKFRRMSFFDINAKGARKC